MLYLYLITSFAVETNQQSRESQRFFQNSVVDGSESLEGNDRSLYFKGIRVNFAKMRGFNPSESQTMDSRIL